MNTYKIASVKHVEDFEGTEAEAIARAEEVNEEYQPAFGVTLWLLSDSGDPDDSAVIWNSEDGAAE